VGTVLLGSIGGWPPLGEANSTKAPESLKAQEGAANSSSQTPLFRPVSPSRSGDVTTIKMRMEDASTAVEKMMKREEFSGLSHHQFCQKPDLFS
jgi:flagellar basal body L-ring protein FlgH